MSDGPTDDGTPPDRMGGMVIHSRVGPTGDGSPDMVGVNLFSPDGTFAPMDMDTSLDNPAQEMPGMRPDLPFGVADARVGTCTIQDALAFPGC